MRHALARDPSAVLVPACGAPVVASERTSIPEIVGDTGPLCDSESPQELAAALGRMLGEPTLAAELRARGFRHAREFSWAAAAETLLATLRQTAPHG